MKKTLELIYEVFNSDKIEKVVFSSKKDKNKELRGVFIQNLKENQYKVELRLSKHNDIKTMQKDKLLSLIENEYLHAFKQIQIKQEDISHQILINKKGRSTIISKKEDGNKKDNQHNRQKKYLIPDGTPCDFLIEIGVMDKRGKVKSSYYKKFRQINRFLEMVNDLHKDTKSSDEIHAVDFGCGKSYLTFALYYYYKHIKGMKPNITGIDLKQEVIDNCNEIAQKLNYTGLKFAHGFIHDFKTDKPIDFVVTLHACDTATDDAILFSLKNKAKKMMFVPCCQHELNKQLSNNEQSILIDSGLFRDRVCSLVTDTMRAKLLEVCGYKVQVMEFIETEHTAKNVLLRCNLNSNPNKNKALEEYQKFAKSWSITPYLEKRLKEEALL